MIFSISVIVSTLLSRQFTIIGMILLFASVVLNPWIVCTIVVKFVNFLPKIYYYVAKMKRVSEKEVVGLCCAVVVSYG